MRSKSYFFFILLQFLIISFLEAKSNDFYTEPPNLLGLGYCQSYDHVNKKNQQDYIQKQTLISTAVDSNSSASYFSMIKKLITKVNFLGEVIPNNKPINLNEKKCATLGCYLDFIFGHDVGLPMLYLSQRFNLNASPFAYEEAQMPELKDLNIWLKALSFVPEHLAVFEKNKKMIKVKLGTAPANKLYSDATMSFFDAWSASTDNFKIYTTFHEFGHNFAHGRDFRLDESEAWKSISGWRLNSTMNGQEHWSYASTARFVSGYAQTNPDEDFAESAVAYRFQPEKLKEISLGKYLFLKNIVYGELEFNHVECQLPTRQKQKLQREFQLREEQWLDRAKKTVIASCFDSLLMNEFFLSLKNTLYEEELQYCVKKEIIKKIAKEFYQIEEMPLSMYDKAERKVYLKNVDLLPFREIFFKYLKGNCSSQEIDSSFVNSLFQKEFNSYYGNHQVPALLKVKHDIVKKILKLVCESS